MEDIDQLSLRSKIYEQPERLKHVLTLQRKTAEKIARAIRTGNDASWSRPQYWPTWGGLTFEMVTERGAVIVDAFRQNLNVYRHDWQRSNWAYWGSDMNHAMISDFVAAIHENRPPRVTGVDGLRALEATLAAYESDRTGQTVQITQT